MLTEWLDGAPTWLIAPNKPLRRRVFGEARLWQAIYKNRVLQWESLLNRLSKKINGWTKTRDKIRQNPTFRTDGKMNVSVQILGATETTFLVWRLGREGLSRLVRLGVSCWNRNLTMVEGEERLGRGERALWAGVNNSVYLVAGWSKHFPSFANIFCPNLFTFFSAKKCFWFTSMR